MIVRVLPNAVIVGDSTQPTYYGNLYSEITSNNRWFNSSTGFGTLGYAIPASLGAKLATPDRPVVCISGDGGLQFILAEFGTAIDESIPVAFIIWNNLEYKEIRKFMESQSIKPIGVSPKPPNLKYTARSFGMDFKSITSSSTLADALTDFHTDPRPLIIEIVESTFYE